MDFIQPLRLYKKRNWTLASLITNLIFTFETNWNRRHVKPSQSQCINRLFRMYLLKYNKYIRYNNDYDALTKCTFQPDTKRTLLVVFPYGIYHPFPVSVSCQPYFNPVQIAASNRRRPRKTKRYVFIVLKHINKTYFII